MIKNDEGIPSRNQKKLASFAEYCLKYPEYTFLKALIYWFITK